MATLTSRTPLGIAWSTWILIVAVLLMIVVAAVFYVL